MGNWAPTPHLPVLALARTDAVDAHRSHGHAVGCALGGRTKRAMYMGKETDTGLTRQWSGKRFPYEEPCVSRTCTTVATAVG